MKFPEYKDYNVFNRERALSALLSVWNSLEEYGDDLVLVGGLAIYLQTTKNPTAPFRPCMTSDVDLGISLQVTSGQYDTIANKLQSKGFIAGENGRMQSEFGGSKVTLDFLTEDEMNTHGMQVDDIVAESFPGVGRALQKRDMIEVSGEDFYGASLTLKIPVCSIGPLLVLKLAAYANRREAKDAYDVVLGVKEYREGFSVALQAFTEEKQSGNLAMETALTCLGHYFCDSKSSAPIHTASFLLGVEARKNDPEKYQQVVESVVTVGKALVAT